MMSMPTPRRTTGPTVPVFPYRRILLLGDSASSRKRRTELLSRHGYQVSSVADAAQALHLCKQQDFVLILIVDRKNPQRAAGLCDAIRAQRPRQMIGLLLKPNGRLPVTNCPDLIWPDEDDDHFLARVETLTAFAAAA